MNSLDIPIGYIIAGLLAGIALWRLEEIFTTTPKKLKEGILFLFLALGGGAGYFNYNNGDGVAFKQNTFNKIMAIDSSATDSNGQIIKPAFKHKKDNSESDEATFGEPLNLEKEKNKSNQTESKDFGEPLDLE